MSMKPPLDPDEIIVKANYFIPGEHEEAALSNIKKYLSRTVLQDGYKRVNQGDLPFLPESRTMTFRLEITKPELPLSFKFREKLGLAPEREKQDILTDKYHDRLKRKRADIPFEIDFHFRTISIQNGTEGYEIEVIARPVLLQQQHQGMLDSNEEYDVKSAISTTKQRITKYARRVEAETFQEPHTEAELLDNSLEQKYRDILRETEHGRTAIQYIDEGDSSFQRDHLNAALSCYIHGIEWVIIDYLKRTGDKDVIEHEKSDAGVLYKYSNLVDGIRHNTPASQRTISYLDRVNGAERRWMAHHKDGSTLKTDVNTLRERLLELIDELFKDQLTDQTEPVK
ncbi:hypothetical protein EXE44_15925 [Halorubrum sp. SS7]|uniref:hypothetical protein n=1 Tax=unclassified Halorubrum TaxID=2642239 RepID=UPI0010F7D62B|nr:MULTISPECIES: hypothetical protein [unclassified Halorubrum]TKX54496.1 hypothetical protein EXE42_08380 [Halorubrum sp. SP3]TKX55947.1 hypothetical protein EXE44_15925 [Halorubrum sp. SS7]